MPTPLDYPRRTDEPPARWSWCAAMGFAISWPGPLSGFFLAVAVERSFPDHPTLEWILMVIPLVAGYVLSIIGVVATSGGNAKMRGRGFAWAGIFLSTMWTILFVIFVMMFVAQVW